MKTISITLGAIRFEWCDECLRSHAKTNVYAYSGDPTRATLAGIWNDGHETQEPTE